MFGPVYETIDLVAKTSDEANIWVTGLRLLITQRTGLLYLNRPFMGKCLGSPSITDTGIKVVYSLVFVEDCEYLILYHLK